jgi:DNA invertase Pin-like site-specific DNA recombinase
MENKELSNEDGLFEVVKKPIAYSYVRFSTAKQELGDSLRRQVDNCASYCERHGLELHPVSYRDLGVSAFKRKNIEKGALAAFIDAVKTGKVPKGSILIIEQFDRMSRDDVDMALSLLLNLVHSGIVLITLADERIWNRETVKEITNLIVAIVFMSRANNESRTKADRLSEKWTQKKLNAGQPGQRIVTSECPRWLAPNEDKTGFVVLEDKAESVRKVFKLRLAGLGAGAITTRANEEGWPVPGKVPPKRTGDPGPRPISWWPSNVTRMLTNRAVLGEYLPHKNSRDGSSKRIPEDKPVLGYYPAILDETTFLRVQALRDRQSEKGSPFPGRRDASYKNWLQGILKCECGRSYVRKNKDSTAQPGYARYYCQGRIRKETKCPGSNAEQLESAVLTIVSAVAPQFFDGTARQIELRASAELAEVECTAARETRNRYVEAIGTSKAPIPVLLTRLNDAEKTLVVHEKALGSIRAELAELSGDSDSVFENIVKAVRDINSIDARAALREDLSRVLLKVVVHETAGYVIAHIRGNAEPVLHPLRPKPFLVPGIEWETEPGSGEYK